MSRKYPLAFKKWWNILTLQGDPLHRPNLVTDAFEAGYEAGHRAALMLLSEHVQSGNAVWRIEDRV